MHSEVVRTTVQPNSVPATVIRVMDGKYLLPWPLLPPPTLYKRAGRRLSPEVRKTVIYNIGGRWNRGDSGAKRAKYFKHLL